MRTEGSRVGVCGRVRGEVVRWRWWRVGDVGALRITWLH